eukprot:TRINITY_DN15991_c0_g1_i3.p1 TRINITY_DN15991_c0_g1~~TRINITY_DN15991_c0_g1_i3.p1  ORF type:complete len:288 (+),score=19.87 TRINITY_DN15991_c0_g1_i3:313-1176(+)
MAGMLPSRCRASVHDPTRLLHPTMVHWLIARSHSIHMSTRSGGPRSYCHDGVVCCVAVRDLTVQILATHCQLTSQNHGMLTTVMTVHSTGIMTVHSTGVMTVHSTGEILPRSSPALNPVLLCPHNIADLQHASPGPESVESAHWTAAGSPLAAVYMALGIEVFKVRGETILSTIHMSPLCLRVPSYPWPLCSLARTARPRTLGLRAFESFRLWVHELVDGALMPHTVLIQMNPRPTTTLFCLALTLTLTLCLPCAQAPARLLLGSAKQSEGSGSGSGSGEGGEGQGH